MDTETEAAAREAFYRLADGASDNPGLLAHRNGKALCLLLALLRERGLLTDPAIADLLDEATR